MIVKEKWEIMKKVIKIDSNIIRQYVDTINATKEPMKMIKHQLENIDKRTDAMVKNISVAVESINKLIQQFPNDRVNIYYEVIKKIMDENNGMITSRMLEPFNISRQYLSNMEKNGDIMRVFRGIYISSNIFEDSYFCFQQKYKKAIFSHMHALYFYGMTEEIPYNYTITVPQNYHVDTINKKCNVFYVSDDIYELGVVEVETPSGNKIRAYDMERCICDIIRSKGRMDPEQVNKSIRQYMRRKDKNLLKLSEYAKKMNISEKVFNKLEVFGE